MTDYSEILLQSVQTLIDKSLADLPSDKNVVCTITDNTNRSVGQYKASSNNVIYDVYSEKETYKVGDQVVVLFPYDDTKSKTILSKYVSSDDTAPLAYVAPSEKVVQTTGNLMSNVSQTAIAVNGETEFVEICTITSGQLQNSKFYDTMHLSADFTCLLSSYNITQGHYGILIEGYTSEAEMLSPATIMQLDSDQMFGNSFAFVAPFKQEILFHYDIEQDYKKLKVYLYQSNDFKYFDGQVEQRVPIGPDLQKDNIFVSNMELHLAYDVASVQDNTVKIVTKDSLSYGSAEGSNKTIELIWYNKTKDNKYIGFSDGVFSANAKRSQAKIKKKTLSVDNTNFIYYLENTGYTTFSSTTEYNEGDVVFYERGSSLTDVSSNIIVGLVSEKETNSYWIDWKIDNANGDLYIDDENGATESYMAKCRPDLSITEVQAVVWHNGESYSSNIIQFKNKDINSNNITNLGITLSFEHVEPGYSTYALYGEDNQLFQLTQANIPRIIKAKWSSRAQNDIADSFWEGAIITWSLPKVATMLLPEPTREVSYEDENYYYYELPYSTANLTFSYLISKTYIRNYSNNTILCSIKLPNGRGTVYGQETLVFSSLGSNGTDYTFVISPTVGGYPWKNEDERSIRFKASLRDADNQEIPINNIKYYRVGSSTALAANSYKQTKSYINRFNLARAKCTAEWGGRQIEFEANYPIIYCRNEKYYAQAPNEIIYSTLGTPVSKNAGAPLKLFEQKTNEEICDVEWIIRYQTSPTGASTLTPPEDLNTWMPTVNKQSAIVGKVLDSQQHICLIGVSDSDLLAGESKNVQCNIIPDYDAGVVRLSKISNGPATILERNSVMKKWEYNSNNIIFTDRNLEPGTYYTCLKNEILDFDIYEKAKEITAESRWGKVAITKVPIEADSLSFHCVMLLDREMDEETGYYKGKVTINGQEEFVYNDPSASVGDPGAVPGFTPSPTAQYLIYYHPEARKYCFLASISSTSVLASGEYTRIKYMESESVQPLEYRYLISVSVSDALPVTGTYVLLDDELKFIGEAKQQNLRLGIQSIYSISVPAMYMNTGYYLTLQARQNWGKSSGVEGEDYEKVVLWSQPLPVSQYRYGSSLLNNWDGNLKVDNENNYILSAMMGAGIKNSDNTFSGVLMGDVGTKLEDGHLDGTIGLYGYDKGQQSFGFKVDGTAFLGKSGRGQILFDGTGGTIQAADPDSMKIDLDDGIISATKFLLDAKNKYMKSYDPQLAPVDEGIWLAKQASITILDDRISAISGWGSALTCAESDNIITCSGTEINNVHPYYILWWQKGSSENLKYQNLTFKDQLQVTCKCQTPGSLKAYLVIWYKQVDEENWNILSTVATPGSGNSKFKTLNLNLSNLEGEYEIQVGIISKPFSDKYIRATELSIVLQRADTLEAETIIRLSNQNKNDNDTVMYIGGKTQNFLKLTQDGQLAINSKKIDFTVDTDNFIKIDNEGVKIRATDFSLGAGDWNNGNAVFVNSGGYLLAAGKDQCSGGSPSWNYDSVKYTNEDEWKEDLKKENYLAIRNSGIEIHTPNFRLESNGDLKIRGSVDVAQGSTIGGWYVGKSGLIYPSAAVESDSGISGADAYFSPTWGLKIKDKFTVNTSGILTATGATIQGAITATSLDISGNATIKGILSAEGDAVIQGVPYSSNSGDFEIKDSKIWWGNTYFNKEGDVIELRSTDSAYRGNLFVEQLYANHIILDNSIEGKYTGDEYYELHITSSSTLPAHSGWVYATQRTDPMKPNT